MEEYILKRMPLITTMNVENTSKTVTSVINRSIKPGYQKDYDDWVLRYLTKALGYLGTTIIEYITQR